MGTNRSSTSSSGTASRRASTTGASSASASTASIPEPEPEDDDESEDEYEVEAIVAHKKHKTTGKLKFCLKWKGFPDSDNTWEDEEHLNCKELVSNYLRDKGLDSRGNEIKASATSTATSTPATRKRSSSAASAPNSDDLAPPATKRSKTAASSKTSASTTHSASSPASTPPTSAVAMPSSTDGIDNLIQLDPNAKSWDDLIVVDTIGAPVNGADLPYYVYGTTHSGQKTCETLKDMREKAPQRLLDFLLRHLKFR
ncbi:hypothetical protein BCR44DRAFT_1429560 [Catenaria anguillulae PL171]|uniref:Chromo domain-containing protein n=1 Tax=Catenaria anguillulae PL171 TaxID=765915 RepID=A0A1Y2HU16_9FUNG|nr:hypothetical protein BCR44DRAFT_1429560 [Catenaria anguillulae PL171]